jgi:hypothetical protein
VRLKPRPSAPERNHPAPHHWLLAALIIFGIFVLGPIGAAVIKS